MRPGPFSQIFLAVAPRTCRWCLTVLCVALLPWSVRADDFDEALDLLRADRPAAALELLRPLHEGAPGNPHVANGLAIALFRSGDGEAAQAVLDDLLLRLPAAGALYSNLQAMRRHQAGEAFAAATGWEAAAAEPELALIEAPPPEPVATAPQASEPPAPAPEVRPGAPDPRDVGQRLNEFVGAWSAGNADAYIDFYKAEYVPELPALHDQWVASRRRLVRPDKEIEVAISDVDVVPGADGSVRTRFRQAYSSSTYSDVVDKTIVWRFIDGKWRIVNETSEAP